MGTILSGHTPGAANPPEREDHMQENHDAVGKPATGKPTPAVPALTRDSKPRDVSDAVVLESLRNDAGGDAELLKAMFGDRLAVDASGPGGLPSEDFYAWHGHWWAESDEFFVEQLLGRVAEAYLHLAEKTATQLRTADAEMAELLEKRLAAVRQRTSQLRQSAHVQKVMKAAKAKLRLRPELWDQQPRLLAVANGVVNLETGELEPGRPADYVRRVAPTRYDPTAQCPLWESSLRVMFRAGHSPVEEDPETVDYLQRLFGYAITGLTVEHIFPVFWGRKGRNGKDTMFETLKSVLGDPLAGPTSKDAILAGEEAATQPYLLDLRGRRLAWVSETEVNARLNANMVKYVTGGGTLIGRSPYDKKVMRFEPTHTICLVTNFKPRVPEHDEALWERLRLFEMTARFVEKPQNHEEAAVWSYPRDAFLRDKLKAEAEGILAWLVRGAVAYFKRGLKPSARVERDTAFWRESVGSPDYNLGYYIERDPEESMNSDMLYRIYLKQSRDADEVPMSLTVWGQKMAAIYPRVHTREGNRYKGIGWAGWLGRSDLEDILGANEDRQRAAQDRQRAAEDRRQRAEESW